MRVITSVLIDETWFSLHSPRAINEGPFNTLAEAFEAAAELAQNGNVESISIVLCRYSKRHECYVELVAGSISIALHSASALLEDADEEHTRLSSTDTMLEKGGQS